MCDSVLAARSRSLLSSEKKNKQTDLSPFVENLRCVFVGPASINWTAARCGQIVNTFVAAARKTGRNGPTSTSF